MQDKDRKEVLYTLINLIQAAFYRKSLFQKEFTPIVQGRFIPSNRTGRLAFQDNSTTILCSVLDLDLDLLNARSVLLINWQLVRTGKKLELEISRAVETPQQVENLTEFYFSSEQIHFTLNPKSSMAKVPMRNLVTLTGHIGKKSIIMKTSDGHYFFFLQLVHDSSKIPYKITVKGGKLDSFTITKIYFSCLVGRYYKICDLKPAKMKASGASVHVSVFQYQCGVAYHYQTSSQPLFDQCWSSQRVLDHCSQISVNSAKNCNSVPESENKECEGNEEGLLSYSGVVTRVIKEGWFYEMDSLHILDLSRHKTKVCFIRVGTHLGIFNTHVLIDEQDTETRAVFVPCTISTIQVEQFSNLVDNSQDLCLDSLFCEYGWFGYKLSKVISSKINALKVNVELELFRNHLFGNVCAKHNANPLEVLFNHDLACDASKTIDCKVISIKEVLEARESQSPKISFKDIFFLVKICITAAGYIVLTDDTGSCLAMWAHSNHGQFLKSPCIAIISAFDVIMEPDSEPLCILNPLEFKIIQEPDVQVEEKDSMIFQPCLVPCPIPMFDSQMQPELVVFVEGVIVHQSDIIVPVIARFNNQQVGIATQLSTNYSYLINVPKNRINSKHGHYIIAWDESCQINIHHELATIIKANPSLQEYICQDYMDISTAKEQNLNSIVSLKAILKSKKVLENASYQIYDSFLGCIKFSKGPQRIRLVLGDLDHKSEFIVNVSTPISMYQFVPGSILRFHRLALDIENGLVCGKTIVATTITAEIDYKDIKSKDTEENLEASVYLCEWLTESPRNLTKWLTAWATKIGSFSFKFVCANCGSDSIAKECQRCLVPVSITTEMIIYFEDGTMEFIGIINSLSIILSIFQIEEQTICKYLVKYRGILRLDGGKLCDLWLDGNINFEKFNCMMKMHFSTMVMPSGCETKVFDSISPTSVVQFGMLRQRTFRDVNHNTRAAVALKNVRVYIDYITKLDVNQECINLLQQLS
jgi:hypothetical protein